MGSWCEAAGMRGPAAGELPGGGCWTLLLAAEQVVPLTLQLPPGSGPFQLPAGSTLAWLPPAAGTCVPPTGGAPNPLRQGQRPAGWEWWHYYQLLLGAPNSAQAPVAKLGAMLVRVGGAGWLAGRGWELRRAGGEFARASSTPGLAAWLAAELTLAALAAAAAARRSCC